MSSLKKLSLALLVVLSSAALVVPSFVFATDDDSCPNNSCLSSGQLNKLSKGRSAVKGNLKTKQHIYYQEDTLEVFIKFSRGWELLADATADAHVVVFFPNAALYSFAVERDIGPTDRKFFSVPLETDEILAVGQYQVALILTIPGGDPANLQDWYNGFRGLLDMEGIYITDEPLFEDSNFDGECDFDDDGDGFCDDRNQTDDDDDDDDDDNDNDDDDDDDDDDDI